MSEKSAGLGENLAKNSYVPASEIPGAANQQIEQFEKLKAEYESFKSKVLKHFPFTLALSILPAQAFPLFEEDEGLTKEEIARKPTHVLLVIPEEEYQHIPKKIKPELLKLLQQEKHPLWVHIKTPVDVWNYGLDSKPEFIDAIAASFPLHDNGLLGALRVANIHKTLVLRKFEKYVASYVVGGSLVRGTAGKDSDVDTFVIIDDTDVKKMPRHQLKERLRGYIYDYIREAGMLAGVKNILNVQVYLLTEFWESVKDANPVIFTFIRDGVPMHDRGTFLPWKLLLKMGKIKPSPEAVDTFMKYGDQNESLVKRRLLDAMIDIYWGVVTPTQALMMLAGEAPPAPKTLVADVKRLFVDKEKIMGLKELKILEKVVNLYKGYEHGKVQSISGAELDMLLKEAGQYDTKLKVLRKKLETRLVEHTATRIHDELFDLLKALLGSSGKELLIKKFEKEFVKSGKMQKRFLAIVKEISKIKETSRKKSFTHNQIDLVRRDATELINALTEYAQRKDFAFFDKNMVRVRYGSVTAELITTADGVYLVENTIVRKIHNGKVDVSSREDLEQSLAKTKNVRAMIDSSVLRLLKEVIGDYTLEW